MCPLVQPSPQSLSCHFNPLLALFHLGPARISSQPQPSAASPAPPGSLIKGWVEGSRLRRWPPAEACSLILKGRHVGSPPPFPPAPSPQLPPPAWPVQCALCGQPEAAFRSPSFPFPFSLLRPPKMRSAPPNGTRLGCFTLER